MWPFFFAASVAEEWTSESITEQLSGALLQPYYTCTKRLHNNEQAPLSCSFCYFPYLKRKKGNLKKKKKKSKWDCELAYRAMCVRWWWRCRRRPPTRSQAIRPRASLSHHHQTISPPSSLFSFSPLFCFVFLCVFKKKREPGNQNHHELLSIVEEKREVIFLFREKKNKKINAELFSGCVNISAYVISDEKERFPLLLIPLRIMEMIIICIENSN